MTRDELDELISPLHCNFDTHEKVSLYIKCQKIMDLVGSTIFDLRSNKTDPLISQVSEFKSDE